MLNYTYLSTPEDLATFGSKELNKYDYLVLIHIPDDQLEKDELNLMRGILERFMKDQSLVVIAQELEAAPDDAFVRSIYKSAFPNRPDFDAYVGASTIHLDLNERVFLTPVYQELKPHAGARRPYFEMLSRSLQALQFSLSYVSLADVPLPSLPSANKNLVIPDGRAIKRYRDEQGMSQDEFGRKCGFSDHKPISKTENGNLIKKDTLERIAKCMGKSPDCIRFSDVVPSRKNLVRLRTETGLKRNELAKKHGLASGSFFDLIENAERVPERVMRTVHYWYEKHFPNRTIPFTDVIDLKATKKLTS